MGTASLTMLGGGAKHSLFVNIIEFDGDVEDGGRVVGGRAMNVCGR